MFSNNHKIKSCVCWLHEGLPLWEPGRGSGWRMLFKNNMVTHGTGFTFEFEGDSQGTLAEQKWGHDPGGSFLPNNSQRVSLIGCEERLSFHPAGGGICHLGPSSSNGPHRCCSLIRVARDWGSENPASGPRSLSIIPEQKRSYPKPGVTSASLPPLKASLPQAQVPSALSFHHWFSTWPRTNTADWVQNPRGPRAGEAGLPGHGFLGDNFELRFEGSRKWLDLLCYFPEKAKQQRRIRGVIKQVAAEFFWRRDGKWWRYEMNVGEMLAGG